MLAEISFKWYFMKFSERNILLCIVFVENGKENQRFFDRVLPRATIENFIYI